MFADGDRYNVIHSMFTLDVLPSDVLHRERVAAIGGALN